MTQVESNCHHEERFSATRDLLLVRDALLSCSAGEQQIPPPAEAVVVMTRFVWTRR